MTFFQSNRKKSKLLTNHKNPSPMYDDMFVLASDSARNPKSFYTCSVKMPSPFASLPREVKAGMTVEAAAVLPLFLFFFLSIGSYIEMIRLHGNLQLALWKTGNELAVFGCALEEGGPSAAGNETEWWEKLAGAVFSSTFVKAQIVETSGKEYLNASPLTKGIDSLFLWESEVFGAGDEIDLIITYSVAPCGKAVGFFPFRMANRYYAHIWNGYAIRDAEQRETVFIAENATVYHMDRSCTHLQLSVRQIGAEKLAWERNRYGRKYTICEKCGSNEQRGIFYISDEGDKYHDRLDCPGLKRTVHSMLKTEAENAYPPCKRCCKEN